MAILKIIFQCNGTEREKKQKQNQILCHWAKVKRTYLYYIHMENEKKPKNKL